MIRIVSSTGSSFSRVEPVAKRLAAHEWHDIEQRAVGVSRVVQRQDVRVLQVGGDLNFLEEPLRAERRREIRLEHLERDISVVPQVVSDIHRGHAALAELPLDAVAVGECGLQLLEVRRERQGDVGHAHPVIGRCAANGMRQRTARLPDWEGETRHSSALRSGRRVDDPSEG